MFTNLQNLLLMKKILVIEDESLLKESIEEVLNYDGFDVLLAENGNIGLKMALKYMPT